jgi:hypothetical protein
MGFYCNSRELPPLFVGGDEFHNLYCFPTVIKMMKLRRIHACSICQGQRDAYRIFVGVPEGKRSLRRGGRIILKWILER